MAHKATLRIADRYMKPRCGHIVEAPHTSLNGTRPCLIPIRDNLDGRGWVHWFRAENREFTAEELADIERIN